MYKNFFKRFVDFSISLIVLICISPILLVITIWLHFANRANINPNPNDNVNPNPYDDDKHNTGNWLQRWLAPAIFLQERPGKDGKIFKVIKFKTMTDERRAEKLFGILEEMVGKR